MDNSALVHLLQQRSLELGDFVLSSGRRSSYYIDARPTTMSASGLDLVGRMGLQGIREMGWTPQVIGGLTMGADPVAYAIAVASQHDPPAIDAFSVRKTVKEHGTNQQIEGNFGAGMSVVVVEDVITTGGSALAAIDAIRGARGTVIGVLAVVDRMEGGRQRIESQDIAVCALTTVADLGVGPTE